MGWVFQGSMIYVNKIYSCSNWDCTLQKRLLSFVHVFARVKKTSAKQGHQILTGISTTFEEVKMSVSVSAPDWNFKKSVNDLSTWLLQLETRLESSTIWQPEIRDVSRKYVSRIFQIQLIVEFWVSDFKSCIVATKHSELEMMDYT